MLKSKKKQQELYTCVKNEVNKEMNTTNQLMRLAQHVSFSQEKQSLIVSFSPPISARKLASALQNCES